LSQSCVRSEKALTGLQIGLNDLPSTRFVCAASNLGRGCLALAQRFSQTFKREIEPRTFLIALVSAATVAKQINHCFGGIIDAHAYAFDRVFLYARAQHLRAETYELKWRCSGVRPSRDEQIPSGRNSRQFRSRNERIGNLDVMSWKVWLFEYGGALRRQSQIEARLFHRIVSSKLCR
jgi:hypothetical protein